ncbi:MAG: PD-(D/E)XK nuclease family protein [Candidatus Glassbacteria bacterium]|nr:PD-(D/E)XK nuclease family protein [Candidatus Glassbacteria bacterium]
MNTLTSAIADFCRTHPADEKWLIAPTRRVGYQWIDSVAAGDCPVLNLHVRTLRGAAASLAAPRLESGGFEILNSRSALLLTGRLFQSRRTGEGGYLFSLRPTPALIARFSRLLEEFRLAGLKPDELAGRAFENGLKGRELSALLENYLEFLEREKLADYAGLLRMAAAELKRERANLPLLLLPEDSELTVMESGFLDSLPGGRVERLPVDSPAEGCGWEKEAGNDCRFRDSTVGTGAEIVRAVGPANEVRGVLRRIISAGIPLEQVELVHPDRETYPQLVYELLQESLPESLLRGDSLPVTFAEGVRSRLTRPGRLLAAWLRWVESGFAMQGIAEMVGEGLLLPPGSDDNQLPYAFLASQLESLPVGKGRDRWIRLLGQRVNNLGRRRKNDRGGVEPRQLEAARLLRDTVSSLLEISPESGGDEEQLVAGACRLIEDFAAHPTELDTYARRALLDRLTGLRDWRQVHGGGIEAAAYLAELAGEVPVMGNAPQPGKLHVAGIISGGHSGRPLSVVLGMDDTRWPPSGGQNPLLLDSERQRLSPGLATSLQRQQRAERELGLLLARLRGRVILSFSSSDPQDGRELFPAPALLPVYRSLCGDSGAGQKQLLESLAAPSSFAPPEAGMACRETDWWLARLLSNRSGESRTLLGEHFPHLVRGEEAVRARLSTSFGVYDGLLAEAGAELDPYSGDGPVLSASGLETLGACPRRYYYRYVLGLEEPCEPPPPSQWLDPAAAGQLVHQVLHRFLERLLEDGVLPENSPGQRELIAAIAAESLAEFRVEFPVPGEAAAQARRNWLLQACRVFLVEEAEYCTRHVPRWLETSIGLAAEGSDELGCDTPLPLALPGGTVRVRGRVDRIDSLKDDGNRFTVTDYKSGGTFSYSIPRPFNGGRRVQHALYLAMVQVRLDKLRPGAAADRFRYFFPAGGGRGEAVVWTAGDLRRGRELLDSLCGISRQGAFAASEDTADCRYCAYRKICGDVETQAAAQARKLEDPANDVLKNVRRVRTYD